MASEGIVDYVYDFIRVRQLNIAVALVLTLFYLLYSYWGVLVSNKQAVEPECLHRGHRSRSRSRGRISSRSHSRCRPRSSHASRSRRYGRCANCVECQQKRI